MSTITEALLRLRLRVQAGRRWRSRLRRHPRRHFRGHEKVAA
ncbi:MAG TPA: hypothetical protein VFR23_12655 [Jiangellaceae bacterium]|nr:hypothetical protein [Jiangellaceae bacterium]